MGVFADNRRKLPYDWCRVPGEKPVKVVKKPDRWDDASVQSAAHALAAEVVVLEAEQCGLILWTAARAMMR